MATSKTIASIVESGPNKIVAHVKHTRDADYRRSVKPAAYKVAISQIRAQGGGSWAESPMEHLPEDDHPTHPCNTRITYVRGS